LTYATSGKSLTDVALSEAFDSDCATLNMIRGQAFCDTATLDPTTTLPAGSTTCSRQPV